MFRPLSVLALCLSIPSVIWNASAQTGGSEILIKGATIESPLETLPTSASVIGQKTIEARGSDHLANVIDLVPNLNYAGGTSRPQFFQIRGIGELEQYEGAPNPSVGVIVDDIDLSGIGGAATLFDIDQVEVLRGPQSIRYGSSALAGIVGLRSVDPSAELNARAEISAGNEDYWSGGVAAGGPVSGTNGAVLARFSAYHDSGNGYRDNLFLGREDTNDRDESTFRGKVRLFPSDDTTIDLGGMYISLNNGYDAFAIDNSFNTQSDRPGADDQSIGAGSVKVTSRVGEGLVLTSLTTALSASNEYSYDGDWGNNPFWEPHAPYDFFSATNRSRHTYSQEFRLSSDDRRYLHGKSSRWTGGLFGQRLNEDSSISEFSDGLVFDQLESSYHANTVALFGQYEIPLGASTAFSLGLRDEYRTSNYDDSTGAHFSPNYNMVGGVAALTHEIGPDLHSYVSLSRGFKGGGFNAGPSVPSELRTYDPEYQWSLESGVKGRWLGGKLETNISVFLARRDDQQLKLAIQDDPSDPLSFTFVTESAATGRAAGLELESRYRPCKRLMLFASGGLLETEFTDVPAGLSELDGRDSSHAPNWQFATGAEYLLGGGFFVRSELTGKDAFYFDDSNNQRSEPYHLVNLSAGYRANNWSVTAWARNLFDERYAVRGFFFGNEPPDFPEKEYVQLGDPLQMGVTLRVEI